MFSRLAFPTFILSTAHRPQPTEPEPGAIYNTGAKCPISWTPDPSGTWKTMYIELMTGDNINMVHLTTIAKVDGTAAPGTYTYTCPSVTVNSAIYFIHPTWTGRFAIASANGVVVPPPNSTQPDGETIPWGIGALTDLSKAVPAPPYLNGGASSNTPSSGSSSYSGVSSPTPAASTDPSSSTLSSDFATPSPSSPAATNGTGGSAASSGSSSGDLAVFGAVPARVARAGVALAIIAGTFTFVF
ncbi:hypothetical protein BGW80DRAFT_1325031 [Lactifluus volemus]|nr:hypothetical protein BGW80DRAFT_1325031 [Lactifluus volemus]